MNDNIEFIKPRKKLKTILKAPAKEDRKNWITLSLRISPELLDDIDHLVFKQTGMSRTCWILQALQQKVRKEVFGE